MALAQLKEPVISGEEVLSILPSFPANIAKELTPLLRKTDIEVYKHFLITMYHYTHNAYEQLIYARDLCEDQVLWKYFDQMAKEERGHYLLAKRDYEEFGGNVESSPEPALVQDFRDYWYSLGKQNVNEFVGAMFVFENVATAVGKEVLDMMARLELTRRQARWLRVHLEADVGHGDEALQMCERHVHDNPSAMLDAAERGAVAWAAVFRHAFSNNG